MQFTINKTVKVLLTAAILVTVSLSQVNAASAGKTYTEDQFLNSFSGKTKKVISDKLGAPFKKELSVKPAGASGFLGKVGADEKDSKRVNVEMWYYKNLVKYDPKHAYKETEITFVNDKVMNIAFFNNR
ncbi:hypothetical protein [Methylotenera sp.]|uniref:hypothetical protein n=1 Tax=Methylotenera sp. TaxID=2051956 RepID=UPI002488BF6B|nr:hypothetical protein [Methylotenera sp.]MDI1298466.1 hypothetical protein [Methylotenera sp.]